MNHKIKIAIVGAGKMGGALGKIWATAGYPVTFSFAKDEQKLKLLAQSAGINARFGSVQEAVESSEVIMLAVPFSELPTVLEQKNLYAGKTVISCVSGLRPDFTGKTIGLATDLHSSVAEYLQDQLPTANVVEAFNITFGEILAAETRDFAGGRPTVFYCGDDQTANQTAKTLIEEAGYEAIEAGGLIVARSLETLASAWVQFAVASQLFPQIGLRALRR
jgi:8-hydroxy-5-deazaflavin:NADPH oxidoreductase